MPVVWQTPPQIPWLICHRCNFTSYHRYLRPSLVTLCTVNACCLYLFLHHLFIFVAGCYFSLILPITHQYVPQSLVLSLRWCQSLKRGMPNLSRSPVMMSSHTMGGQRYVHCSYSPKMFHDWHIHLIRVLDRKWPLKFYTSPSFIHGFTLSTYFMKDWYPMWYLL